MQHIEGEIIVVDNASVDGTAQQVRQHFADVHLIANQDNRGFATANNQGIVAAKGEFILLLNPDTIVSEDTFSSCIQFMEQHLDAGAIGVKMLDGSGRFLPESKRGLPTLSASFMKMTGLYRLFPRSAKWNHYYEGQIDENETAKIEVLCGAFMFMRKEALEKSGYLDEDFFMYGEDIDLSYRITKAGYAIYYLPTTSIIHYKGESTRKSSLNYILTFYQAMLIFTQKHPEFSGQKVLIQLAIYFHGLIQLLKQNVTRWWPVVMDAVLISSSFFVVSKAWAIYKYGSPDYFQPEFYYFNIPLYTFIMLIAMHLNGAYDHPFTKRSSWLGFFSGILIILVIYAILPVYVRSSRMVIVMGTLLYMGWLILTRSKLNPWRAGFRQADQQTDRKAIIVASEEEAGRIKELINRSKDHIEVFGTVSLNDVHTEIRSDGFIGSIAQLEDVVRIYQIREIIFSAQDVPFSVFTGSMMRLGPGLRYMLAASTTMNIVGSMGKDIAGESYAIRIHFKLTEPSAKRSKRLFDIVSSFIFLAAFPVLVFIISNPIRFLQNIFQVITGQKTWVSYHPLDPMVGTLPKLAQGVLHPAYPRDESDLTRRLQHIHYVYARDYHWTTDLSILVSQLKKTGKTNSGYGQ